LYEDCQRKTLILRPDDERLPVVMIDMLELLRADRRLALSWPWGIIVTLTVLGVLLG
jgi:hypothetical protein